MGVLNEGANKSAAVIGALLTEGDWGTGTTPFSPTDTGLETEVSGIEVSTTVSISNDVVQVTAVLPSTSGNGNTISEHVVRFTSGEDFARVVFSGISKTANKEIHNISPFVFQGD